VEVVLFAEKAVGVCAAWHEENTGRLVESVPGTAEMRADRAGQGRPKDAPQGSP
jgi:hypothetical protein